MSDGHALNQSAQSKERKESVPKNAELKQGLVKQIAPNFQLGGGGRRGEGSALLFNLGVQASPVGAALADGKHDT